MSTSTSEYAKILEELKMIKADAATGLEHDRAIMAFVFFNFVLLLLLLILLIMIYKIMPRGGKPPAMTNYMSPMPPPPPPVISMPGPMPTMAPPVRSIKVPEYATQGVPQGAPQGMPMQSMPTGQRM